MDWIPLSEPRSRSIFEQQNRNAVFDSTPPTPSVEGCPAQALTGSLVLGQHLQQAPQESEMGEGRGVDMHTFPMGQFTFSISHSLDIRSKVAFIDCIIYVKDA